jgi:hypothetical protein
MNIFSISLDTDWVNDEILDFTLEILSKHGIKATFFCTNKTSCDLTDHEVGIHPNFTTMDLEKHVSEMLDLFPDSKGLRSHSLFFSERLRPILANNNIKYTSNTMMFEQCGIKSYMISQTVREIPIYFMDTFNLIMKGADLTFENDKLLVEQDGLKVFDFHPIHIYANTRSIEHYDSYKKFYHDTKMLKEYRNVTYPGVRDYFIELLNYIKMQDKILSTMLELSSLHKNYEYAGTNNR